MTKTRAFLLASFCAAITVTAGAISVPIRAQKGIVASQNEMASKIGADVVRDGGTAVDAAVATAFALAVVHPTAGNMLNNEMGDFNAGPELTNAQGLIGTKANLAEPGKRMLSSMSPTILAKDGQLFMVTGSPGGRTIINTVLETIVDVVDFGMNAQEAIDAPRFHHQWLPDVINFERMGFSPDTIRELERRGHTLREGGGQGVAQVILYDAKTKMLEGGTDRRVADGGAVPVR